MSAMQVLDLFAPLAAPELALSAELDTVAFDAAEAVIERGKDIFVGVGTAILAIRDGGQAERERRGYGTFEAYMQGRWGWSRDYGYKLARAAEVVRNIGVDNCLQSGLNEGQARQLAPLAPEQQRAAWAEAVRTSPDGRPHLRDLQKLAKQEAAQAKARRIAARPTPPPVLPLLPLDPSAGRLFRGDCLEILPTLPTDSVQLVLTSPPYNVRWRYGTDDGQADDLPLPEYHDLLARAMAGCWRALRPGGVLALNLPQTIRLEHGGDPTRSRNHAIAAWALAHLEQTGWLLREPLVWLKAKDDVQAHAMGTAIGSHSNPSLRPTHEMWLLASKGTYQLPGKEPRWPGTADDFGSYLERCKDVWPFRPGRAAEGDPLAWPEGMIDGLVWLYSSAGDTVLDPFAGNGVAAASARRQGRIPWLIEREPTYWPRLEAVLREAA